MLWTASAVVLFEYIRFSIYRRDWQNGLFREQFYFTLRRLDLFELNRAGVRRGRSKPRDERDEFFLNHGRVCPAVVT